MSILIEQPWKLPDVDTVFDMIFAFSLNEVADDFRVTVKCLWPPAETQFVRLDPISATAIALRFKSGYDLRGQMRVVRDGDRRSPSIGVEAKLQWQWNGQFPIQHFEGLAFLLEGSLQPPPPGPPGPPDPPICLPPDAPPDDERPPIITPRLDELFPYVDVRQWPKIADEDLEFGFFRYAGSSPPAGSFIDDLAGSVAAGRKALESLAVDFIDGAPPYAGQFIPSRNGISGPAAGFAPIALPLQRLEPWSEEWIDQLRIDVAALLRRYDQTGAYLLSPAYVAALDQVWQSYFALVVTLGYDEALLDDFALTLWLANAIEKALVVEASGRLETVALSVEQRTALARASVLLPSQVFPLPPAVPAPPRAISDGWVEPYAVGDLQMVRQRLLRYSAGEIARIENVLRGERREVSSRQGRQRLDVQQQSSEDQQALESDGADERVSLSEEISRAVAGKSVSDSYGDFQTSYGPPAQATLSGTLTRTTIPITPASDDVTRFARTILGKTVNRIARKVESLRASSTLSHVEDAVVSVIDNSAGDGNLCAVYRWVNKVYEACVVNYGNRLIMEFVLRRPAADFAARHDADRRGDVAVPPAQLGYCSFEDVNAANYARLCAAYGVTDIAPPPSVKIVAASLRAGDEAQVAIPAGYCARTAYAGWVSASAAPAPQILVGYLPVPADGDATPLSPRGEDSTLPVAVADMPAGASPPVPADALVNVEIECEPTRRCTDEWKIGIYAAVVKAYEQSVERRLTALAERTVPVQPRSPLACREIERQALKRGCEQLLLERMALITGADGTPPQSPPAETVDEPRYLQFLDQALEWPEMTYSFHAGRPGEDHAAEGEDGPLGRFLHADRARILVPVRPERALAFLYYFSSGMVWDGPDWLVAVNSGDVDVVDDLKRASRCREPERRVGPPWEVVVPTAMQILDQCDRAPCGGDVSLVTQGASA